MNHINFTAFVKTLVRSISSASINPTGPTSKRRSKQAATLWACSRRVARETARCSPLQYFRSRGNSPTSSAQGCKAQLKYARALGPLVLTVHCECVIAATNKPLYLIVAGLRFGAVAALLCGSSSRVAIFCLFLSRLSSILIIDFCAFLDFIFLC